MPQYRYFTADILTGAVQAELPLYGVWITRRLSEAGEMTGTFKLGSGLHNDQELLDGSIPGRVALYAERDGTIIWGGIIWSRTWAEDAKICNLTAQTFESIFDHVVVERDFVHQGEDQMQIFKALVDAIQLQQNNDFGLDTSGIGTCGVLRTVLVPGYEYRFAETVVSQLVGVEDGFDYTIDIVPGTEIDQPRKIVRTGYPVLGSRERENIASYDYPGNIDKFWWPESATRGGTKFVGLGNGQGIGMVRATRYAQKLLDAGYPAWWIVKAYKGVTDASFLGELVGRDRDLFTVPVSAPSFVIKSDAVPSFDRWNDLGASFNAHIESDRFPQGKDVVSRMIGWELTVASSSDVETLMITVEGDVNG